MKFTRNILSRGLPVVVSVLAMAFILTRVDLAGAASQVNSRVAAILIPALLLYGAFSLWIEALCLRAVIPATPGMALGTAARIKAASYLLNLVHYAAGAGAVGVLIRRRVGLGLADAMGVVMLIVLFDLAMLMLVTAAGATLVGSEKPLIQSGVVIGAGGLIALGLAVLRAPVALGPLDRLRDLELFRAARTAPIGVLVRLSGLRLVFVSSFIALVQAALIAFEVRLPLGDVILGVAVVSLVAALPIAVAGLGTGQIAFVYVFQAGASEETLLACSLALSAGLILLRSLIGIVFAREFTREAFAVAGGRGSSDSDLSFTGERLHAGNPLFGVDLARHRAAYAFAIERAPEGRVLDLGCGSGYGAAELAEALPSVVGLDRVAPDRGARGRVAYVRADLEAVPLPPDCFDLISSFQVIEHLVDPTLYLNAMSRMLKPGGTALVTTPNLLTSDKENPFHVHEYEAEELRNCLLGHFGEVEMFGVGTSPRAAKYFEERLKRIATIVKLDPLRLRHKLPRRFVDWSFAKLALVVRRGIQRSGALPEEITALDFPIGPMKRDCIDLLAICRSPIAKD